MLVYEDLEFLTPYMHTELDVVGTSLDSPADLEANARLGAAAIAVLAGPLEPAAPRFLRGDADGDGQSDLSDAVLLLGFLFLSGPRPSCLEALDANDDGEVDIADPLAILFHLFAGPLPLPDPSGACGPDPTADLLGCEADPCSG